MREVNNSVINCNCGYPAKCFGLTLLWSLKTKLKFETRLSFKNQKLWNNNSKDVGITPVAFIL